MTTRRDFLAGGTAAAILTGGAPLRADTAGWGGVVDAARALGQLRGLIVARRGEVVVAEALRGPALTRPVNVKSVSKTIVASVTGAAVDRGVVPGLQATLGELAPDLIPSGADPRVAGLTVENLVTMQAGLERTSGGNYGGWVSSRTWVANALSRPLWLNPGSGCCIPPAAFTFWGRCWRGPRGKVCWP